MIPLVPALILAGSVLTGGAGAALTVDAVSRSKEAKRRYDKRRAAFDEAKAKYDRSRTAAEKSFERLGKRRLQAVVTLGKAVEFLERARARDRDVLQEVKVTPH